MQFYKSFRRKGIQGSFRTLTNKLHAKVSKVHLNTSVIEITNACNLRCRMCYVAQARAKGEPIRYMREGFFRRVVDELAEMRVYNVGLNFGGESLLHPRFLDMLRYACKKRQDGVGNVSWITNGMLFDHAVAEAAVELKVDAITFSLDMLGHENDQWRVGSNYDVIADNIRHLNTLRAGRRKPRMVINKIDIQDHEHTRQFIKYWKSWVDAVQLSPLNQPHFQIHDVTKCEATGRQYCPMPFNTVGLLADGRVSACTCDDNGLNTMGNLNQQSLKEVWRGSQYQQLRRECIANAFDENRPCAKCDVWRWK